MLVAARSPAHGVHGGQHFPFFEACCSCWTVEVLSVGSLGQSSQSVLEEPQRDQGWDPRASDLSSHDPTAAVWTGSRGF